MKCYNAMPPILYLKFRLLRILIEKSVSQWSQILPKLRRLKVTIS
jgi:hypothetical protein